jgi:pimeloyl-ACP methyl ester carboxylesterase
LALQLQDEPQLRQPDGLILLSAARQFPEGHPVFFLPSCALWCLQPMLSKALVSAVFTSEADPELLKEMRASSGRNDMYMCKAYYRQIKNLPEEDIRRVPTRALVVHGSLDGIVSAEEAEALASELSGSGELMTLEDVSHNLMLERPDLVVNLVRDFVASFPQPIG